MARKIRAKTLAALVDEACPAEQQIIGAGGQRVEAIGAVVVGASNQRLRAARAGKRHGDAGRIGTALTTLPARRAPSQRPGRPGREPSALAGPRAAAKDQGLCRHL